MSFLLGLGLGTIFVPSLMAPAHFPKWAIYGVVLPFLLLHRKSVVPVPVALILAWAAIQGLWATDGWKWLQNFWTLSVMAMGVSYGTSLTRREWGWLVFGSLTSVAINAAIVVPQLMGWRWIPQAQAPAGLLANKNFLGEFVVIVLAATRVPWLGVIALAVTAKGAVVAWAVITIIHVKRRGHRIAILSFAALAVSGIFAASMGTFTVFARNMVEYAHDYVFDMQENPREGQSKVLPLMPREILPQVATEEPAFRGAKGEGDGEGLRQRLQEAGETAPKSMRSLRDGSGGDAPRGLQQAAGSHVALPPLPSWPSLNEIKAVFAASTIAARLTLWANSIPMVLDNPFGHGGGAYWGLYPKYHDALLNWNVATYTGQIRPDSPHNDIILILVEYGIPGLLFVTILGYYAFSARRCAPEAANALFAFVLCGLFGFPLREPATALFAAFALGHLLGLRHGVCGEWVYRRDPLPESPSWDVAGRGSSVVALRPGGGTLSA